jgi:SHS2 domain-containing protein
MPDTAGHPAGFEILEHTADVGIRSWGRTEEEAFEQAGLALAEILGVREEGSGDRREVRAAGHDPGALLVDFLNQLVFVHETEEVGFASVDVVEAADTELRAEIQTVPLTREPEGPPVKGATFHRLRVDRRGGRVEATVYLDV